MLNVFMSQSIDSNSVVFKERILSIDKNADFYYSHNDKTLFDIAISSSIDELEMISNKSNKCILILTVNSNDDIFKNQKIDIRFYLRTFHFLDDLDSMFKHLKELLLLKCKVISYKRNYIEYHIKVDSIIYIESFRNQIKIHTATVDYEMRMTLKDVMKYLDEHFIQCHKSFVINLEDITNIESDLITLNDEYSVPLGRKHKEEVKQKMLELCEG